MRNLNVKIGDKVNAWGHIGTVEDIYHGIERTWKNGVFYEVEGTDYYQAKIKFDEDDSWSGTNYDGEWFGDLERI